MSDTNQQPGTTLYVGSSNPDSAAREMEHRSERPPTLAPVNVLSDPMCRAILKATREQPLTARELSEQLNQPVSTVYRKLDELAETPLIEQTHRLAVEKKHPRQYQCTVDQIYVQLPETVDASGGSDTPRHADRTSDSTAGKDTDDDRR